MLDSCKCVLIPRTLFLAFLTLALFSNVCTVPLLLSRTDQLSTTLQHLTKCDLGNTASVVLVVATEGHRWHGCILIDDVGEGRSKGPL